MNQTFAELAQLILYLRITYAVAFIGSGIDKFFCRITNWYKHGTSCSALYARGIVEVVIGCALCTPYIEYAAYAATVWLLVSAAMVVMHPDHRDTAFRYAVISLGAYTLARLAHIMLGHA